MNLQLPPPPPDLIKAFLNPPPPPLHELRQKFNKDQKYLKYLQDLEQLQQLQQLYQLKQRFSPKRQQSQENSQLPEPELLKYYHTQPSQENFMLPPRIKPGNNSTSGGKLMLRKNISRRNQLKRSIRKTKHQRVKR